MHGIAWFAYAPDVQHLLAVEDHLSCHGRSSSVRWASSGCWLVDVNHAGLAGEHASAFLC